MRFPFRLLKGDSMQSVSNIYKSIAESHDYHVETALILCDNSIPLSSDYTDSTHKTLVSAYDEEMLWSISTTRNAFTNNKPEVGCCTCGEIDLQMLKPSTVVPQMARITPYVRLVSNADLGESEWIRKGVYFIDSRNVTKNDDDLNILTLHGYDSMLKTEDFYPWSSEASPTALQAVNAIAQAIGVEVDPRTTVIITQNNYTVTAPIGYTMRENLEHIASAYGGNFIINDLGMLQLICLWDLPEESNLLSDEYYNAITFGTGANLTRIDLGEED